MQRLDFTIYGSKFETPAAVFFRGRWPGSRAEKFFNLKNFSENFLKKFLKKFSKLLEVEKFFKTLFWVFGDFRDFQDFRGTSGKF